MHAHHADADSNAPTWANNLDGHVNLRDANLRSISFAAPGGKVYRLRPERELATLLVRPRGWHMLEKHMMVDGAPVSASLFDFGLYFFHNARQSVAIGSGPYFYLPKMESHLEARLWNDVFNLAQGVCLCARVRVHEQLDRLHSALCSLCPSVLPRSWLQLADTRPLPSHAISLLASPHPYGLQICWECRAARCGRRC